MSVDLTELRSRIPLEPLISRHVRLKRAGRLRTGCCPFHTEKTASFTVYPDGHFHCFGCGAHGDAVGFTMRIEGLDFGEAVERLAREVGLDGETVSAAESARRQRAAAEARRRAEAASAALQAEEDAEAIATARRRVARATAPGDLVDTYLVGRGIPKPASGWPDAIRWDARAGAMVAVATDAAGAVRAVQLVYLDGTGRKVGKAEIQRRQLPGSKQTFGRREGAAMRLPALHPGPLYVAEGPETALSVWAATVGGETWAALGGLATVELPLNRPVVVCADDDARHKPALRKALRRWQRQGADVTVARPWAVRRENGSDFADLLAEHGTGAVEQRILAALEPGWRSREPTELGIVQWRVARAIETLSGIPLIQEDRPLPNALMQAPAGSGKTEAALRYAIGLVRKLRADGDDRNVAIASPRHDLNEEELHRLLAMIAIDAPDLRAAILRGPDAVDPDHRAHRMCRDRPLLQEALTVRQDPRKTVCRACPLNCGLRAQDDVTADIWLVTHAHTFNRKPAQLGKLAWLVLDEDPASTALFGTGAPDDPTVDDKPVLLHLHALRRGDRVKDDPEKTQRLSEFNVRLADALWIMPDGPTHDAALAAAGITADAAEQSIGLEYDTEIKLKIEAGASLDEMRTLLKTADINRDLGARVMLKRELARQMRAGLECNPRVEICTVHDRDGAHRAVRMMGVRRVHKGWQVPTVIMSATAQPETLRMVWPELRVHEFDRVKAPYRRIRQVSDRAFSLSMLDAEDDRITGKNAAAERRRRQRNLRNLHAWLYRQALTYAPGEVLVVIQKRLIPQLAKLGPLPRNITLGHHGGLSGLDRFGGVRALIVIGRQQPPPAAMERAAEALSGRPVEHLAARKWYPLRDAKRELATGELVLTEAEFHPDPLVEKLRWAACEGELVQIVERGRGAERTPFSPLDVWLLTNVPVPLPIDEVIHSDDLRPRAEDLMLAQLGRMFENAGDAARALHPDLTEAQIARKAATLRQRMHEERETHGCNWQPPPGLVRASYRKQAAGAHHNGVWLPKDEAAGLAAELADLVGPLASGPEIASSGASIGSEHQNSLTERQRPEASAAPVWAGLTPESVHRQVRPPDG
jgi:hypothetical protein